MSDYNVSFRTQTNEDFRAGFVLGVNLTGATLKMDMRKNRRTDAVLTLSTGNGRILIVDASTGEIAIAVNAEDMAEVAPGVYVQDLIVTTSDGVTTSWWSGQISVEDGVTAL